MRFQLEVLIYSDALRNFPILMFSISDEASMLAAWNEHPTAAGLQSDSYPEIPSKFYPQSSQIPHALPHEQLGQVRHGSSFPGRVIDDLLA